MLQVSLVLDFTNATIRDDLSLMSLLNLLCLQQMEDENDVTPSPKKEATEDGDAEIEEGVS